jgi:hypothetical protein
LDETLTPKGAPVGSGPLMAAVEMIAAACRCSNIRSIAKNDQLTDQLALNGEIEGKHQRIR